MAYNQPSDLLTPEGAQKELAYLFSNSRTLAHLILLDHQQTFFRMTAPEEVYAIYITYGIDAGYGYSRGPFDGVIRIFPHASGDYTFYFDQEQQPGQYYWHNTFKGTKGDL